MKELTCAELAQLEPDSYLLIDIRNPDVIACGAIPGSTPIPEQEIYDNLTQYAKAFAPEKTMILYCQKGFRSGKLIRKIESQGRKCLRLSGGYLAYLEDLLDHNEQKQ